MALYIYILSVYIPFSDRVGLPPHNAPFLGLLMKNNKRNKNSLFRHNNKYIHILTK